MVWETRVKETEALSEEEAAGSLQSGRAAGEDVKSAESSQVMQENCSPDSIYLAGIDIGSTTTKIVVVREEDSRILFANYTRHNADQIQSAADALRAFMSRFPGAGIRLCLTGSGSKPIAEFLGVPFMQEVAANALALGSMYSDVGTAIELGGQDAKIIFFGRDQETGAQIVRDMRMNGSCAGGTGAFIDEIATVLKTRVEDFNALAAGGTHIYDISGRCGVYAKTDIQPLLNQGAAREDLALSAFHAIAKQTIGGLAQGLKIEPPVFFEGGPLTFNPVLVRVFKERLALKEADAVVPERAELMVAYGAALSLTGMYASSKPCSPGDLRERLIEMKAQRKAAEATGSGSNGYFASEEDRKAFDSRHRKKVVVPKVPRKGEHVRGFLGIDAGSTTTKFVLMDEHEEILDSFYAPNEGDPLTVAKDALIRMRDRYREAGATLEIIAAGSTGYGEQLFAKAFGLYHHTVETVAHVRAAEKYTPDATFILDIGGQDMKAIWVDHGVITNILLNEACSSGCGSFLENFASSLHIPTRKIAETAFTSQSPAVLGSRCTVFMNSSIITEQRNGKLPADIMAGLCRSIIENVFTKVIRLSNLDSLGDRIIVQGGTFENDAVLKAMEDYTGRQVIRSPYPGIMGAIGIALIVKEKFLAEFGGIPEAAGIAAAVAGDSHVDVSLESAGKCAAALAAAGGSSYGDEDPSPAGKCTAGGTVAEKGSHGDVVPASAGKISAESTTTEGNIHRDLDPTTLGKPSAEEEDAAPAEPYGRNYWHAHFDLEGLDSFSYEQEANVPCPFCGNHCSRTIVRFSNGEAWVMNNRCEKGTVLGDPKDPRTRDELKERTSRTENIPNMYKVRERLLFADYEYPEPAVSRGITIGMPRVLSFWDTMPFWSTFWRALGFKIRISDRSTRTIYESGLSSVTSDTICFPAKLVHGHLRNLVKYRVDRIFMPSITTVPPENDEATSESMCAIVKGFPIVIRNSDNPERTFGVPFDAPLFHWHTRPDRNRQLTGYMEKTFGISREETLKAVEYADRAEEEFGRKLKEEGGRILEEARRRGRFAVVLASRPYQNDALVNHDLPDMFVRMGIPVLTADSLPEINHTELKLSRLDIVNNYHARMLSSAILAARDNALEYVQIVSFGCGHDAYLSDEITRLMGEISGKTPLIVKLDESDIQGPLGIRIRSFLETVEMRRSRGGVLTVHELTDPYAVKFTKESRKERVVLVPNTSHAFCRVMSAAMGSQGIMCEPLDLGREEAIRLGKQYVHNDICFPAQVVIGEALAALRSGRYEGRKVAIGMGKYIGDCRLTHYSALLRKALDDAGYKDVPILTNDDKDSHDLHPGFRMNLFSSVKVAFALPMIDVLEELLRKIRPYERVRGSADAAFEAAMDALIDGLSSGGVRGAAAGFKKGIALMKDLDYDRSRPRPRVLIVGEYLLNFHPGANHDIEAYLEDNGFEIIEARMTDVIRKTYFYQDTQIHEYKLKKPLGEKAWLHTANKFFDAAHSLTDSIAKAHPLYEPATRMDDLVKDSDQIIHHTFDAGEGVLIPGEIIHNARHGCRYFIILQPFGCLPNHVVGRGIARRLKELYPDVQILPLDYDPDVSFANIENRLQMMVMNAKREMEQDKRA